MLSMKSKPNKLRNLERTCYRIDGVDTLVLWVSKLSRNKPSLVCFSLAWHLLALKLLKIWSYQDSKDLQLLMTQSIPTAPNIFTCQMSRVEISKTVSSKSKSLILICSSTILKVSLNLINTQLLCQLEDLSLHAKLLQMLENITSNLSILKQKESVASTLLISVFIKSMTTMVNNHLKVSSRVFLMKNKV